MRCSFAAWDTISREFLHNATKIVADYSAVVLMHVFVGAVVFNVAAVFLHATGVSWNTF